ncbi:hypothetical protein RCL1_005323 [Eukaryota sp. TZLM3-RCL]
MTLPCDFSFYVSKRTNHFKRYADSVQRICTVTTVNEFLTAYQFIKRPSQTNIETNFHFFRNSNLGPVKPEWEDPANASGGRLILRAGKDHADFLWETLLFELASGRMFEYAPNVTGIVISCRASEVVISIWCASQDEAMVNALRERIPQILFLPSDQCGHFQSYLVT